MGVFAFNPISMSVAESIVQSCGDSALAHSKITEVIGLTAFPRKTTSHPPEWMRGLGAPLCHIASMSNVIGYARVEKLRVLRAALLDVHRRAAETIKAGATWSQIEAEDEKAVAILRQIKALLAAPAE
jgi:hypothetical protein